MKRLLILIISAFAISLITPFEAIAEEGALEIKLHKKTLPTKSPPAAHRRRLGTPQHQPPGREGHTQQAPPRHTLVPLLILTAHGTAARESFKTLLLLTIKDLAL